MNHYYKLSIVGLVMLTANITQSAEALTLQQAIEETIKSHPKIGAANAEIRSLEFERNAVEAGNKPKVKAIAGLSQGGALDDFSSNSNRQGLEVSYTLYDAGRTEYQLRQKDAEVSASTYKKNGEEEILMLKTIESYIKVLQSKSSIHLAKEHEARNVKILDLVRDLVKVRLRDRSELNLAKARYEQARISVTQKEMELSTAESDFYRVVGSAAQNLIKPQPVKPDYDRFEQLFDVASSHNSDLKVLQSETEVARVEQRIADTWNKPSLILRAELARSGDKKSSDFFFNDNRLSMDVEWSLYDGNAGASNAQASHELVVQALENEKDKTREIRDDVSKVWMQYQDRQRTYTLNQRNTEASRQVLEATKQQFQLAKKSLLDVKNAERELFDEQLVELETEYEWLTDGYRVLAAQGVLKQHFMPSKKSYESAQGYGQPVNHYAEEY